ncbi:transmembrane protein 161B [Trichonephila clavipes]|nr:transmembrane protein 161B [Trichonephila clavipes]
MAIFGVQLVVTMVMASVLQKVSAHFSVARWLLSYRLTRYLHPSDEELLSVAGLQRVNGQKKGKKSKDRKDDDKDSEFMVPKNLELQLDVAAVHPNDMIQLHYYSEYQWLLDFSLCALIVYVVTEVYYYLIPAKDEVNLSILWCILVVGFAAKILLSLTALYFRGEEAVGERSLCLTAGFLFFFLAMIVLIADENFLEFGLEPAYSSFNASAHTFLMDQGLDSSGPASKLMFKLSLALWCGFIGSFFTFPGLRLARMHKDALKYCSERPFLKTLLHISFISPMFIVLMWVKPVSRHYFTERTWPGIPQALMSPDAFDTTRLVLIIVIVAIRFLLMPHYLQSYLNMAPEKLRNLRKEAGKISNVELQKMVARVFYYLCVVTLQYLTPLMLCLFSALLLKTLGDYKWSSYMGVESSLEIVNATAAKVSPLPVGSDILQSSQQFSLTLLSLKKVFTPILYRVNKMSGYPELLKQLALEVIDGIPLDALKIYTDGSKRKTNTTGSGVLMELPGRIIKIQRNADHASVIRMFLIAVMYGLSLINNVQDQAFSEIWILTDSRSSIQHLSNWPSIGDSTSRSLPRNKVADDLAKAADNNLVDSEDHMVLTSTEIYSRAEELICSTWVVRPVHPWYFQRHPESAISFKGFRSYQMAFSQFSAGHPRCMNFEDGKRSFPICTKCDISPFSPWHILQCLGFSCEEAVASPAVLRLFADLWALGISPTTDNNMNTFGTLF